MPFCLPQNRDETHMPFQQAANIVFQRIFFTATWGDLARSQKVALLCWCPLCLPHAFTGLTLGLQKDEWIERLITHLGSFSQTTTSYPFLVCKRSRHRTNGAPPGTVNVQGLEVRRSACKSVGFNQPIRHIPQLMHSHDKRAVHL